MLFTSIYRKKINAAEALIPLVAFNFKTYPNFKKIRFGFFPQSGFFCFCLYSIISLCYFALFRQFANNRQTSKKCNQVWKHH